MKNVFDAQVCQEIINRIKQLSPESQPEWGKMNAAQMFAHCNVTYESIYTDMHPKATGLKRFMLKFFVKNVVVSEKPYQKNSRTAPEFIIADEREFATEKQRLIDYINKTQELGGAHFDGKESNSFGPLTTREWSNTFYKHLEHHLTQFGV